MTTRHDEAGGREPPAGKLPAPTLFDELRAVMSSDLSDRAKLTMLAVHSRAGNGRGACWASNATIGASLGKGGRSANAYVSRAVAELAAAGWLVAIDPDASKFDRRRRLVMGPSFHAAAARAGAETREGKPDDPTQICVGHLHKSAEEDPTILRKSAGGTYAKVRRTPTQICGGILRKSAYPTTPGTAPGTAPGTSSSSRGDDEEDSDPLSTEFAEKAARRSGEGARAPGPTPFDSMPADGWPLDAKAAAAARAGAEAEAAAFVGFYAERGAVKGDEDGYRRLAVDLLRDVFERDAGRPHGEEIAEALAAAVRGDLKDTAAVRSFLAGSSRRNRAEALYRGVPLPDVEQERDAGVEAGHLDAATRNGAGSIARRQACVDADDDEDDIPY